MDMYARRASESSVLLTASGVGGLLRCAVKIGAMVRAQINNIVRFICFDLFGLLNVNRYVR